MHPECNPYEFYGPSNLHEGEALVRKIYDAVRNSPDWDSTVLIILFDEHGGCYDHVSPPSADECAVAISPDDKIIPPGQPGGSGFRFDRLGGRVPAIIVSAYTPPQTRLHQIFEHTSVLSTVVNCFDLPQHRLGERQIRALDVGAALTLRAPRNDRPAIAQPRFSILGNVISGLRSIIPAWLRGAKPEPVSDLRIAALHGAAIVTQSRDLHDRIENIATEQEAAPLAAELQDKLENTTIR
jgi:phospholipase C